MVVKLTVFLFRCGETAAEAWDAYENGTYVPPDNLGGDDDNDDDAEDAEDDENDKDKKKKKKRDGDGKSDDDKKKKDKMERKKRKKNRIPTKQTISQRIDPDLTERGIQQSQKMWIRFFQSLAESTEKVQQEQQGSNENNQDDDNNSENTKEPVKRRLVAFSAPLRSCTLCAYMMSCSRFPIYGHLMSFRLTTIETAKAPMALPVIIVNNLIHGDEYLYRFGGTTALVDAGLLPTAATDFNASSHRKSPFLRVYREMKEIAIDHVRAWKEELVSTTEGNETALQRRHRRRVTAVQYLRLTDPINPWSMDAITPKLNVLVDSMEKGRYLKPGRKGSFDSKLPTHELSVEPIVKQAVMWSRQVGCDTVLLVVPSATIKQMLVATQRDDPACIPPDDIPPCSIVSLTAFVDDDITNENNQDVVKFKLHGTYTLEESDKLGAEIIPPYEGVPITGTIPPPEGKDPDTILTNQWSKFPPPPPEVIPPNYPSKMLPQYSHSLEYPIPKTPKWWKYGKEKAETSTDEDQD